MSNYTAPVTFVRVDSDCSYPGEAEGGWGPTCAMLGSLLKSPGETRSGCQHVCYGAIMRYGLRTHTHTQHYYQLEATRAHKATLSTLETAAGECAE